MESVQFVSNIINYVSTEVNNVQRCAEVFI